MLRFLLAGILLTLISGCAAKLPYERKVSTKGLGIPLDTSAVFFTDIDTGEQINLADYLDKNEQEFALLMFSSRGCTVCTSKMQTIVQEVRPTHEAFALTGSNNFELIGVNVDGPKALGLVARESKRQGFDFLRWNDAGAENMQKYFLPPGAKLSVPFTAFVSKTELIWFLKSDEKLTTEEIFDKVMLSLRQNGDVVRGDNGNKEPGPTPGPDPVDPGPLPLPPGKLSERLKGIDLTACQSSEVTSLEQIFDSTDLRFVHAVPVGCDDDCRHNHSQLQQLVDKCRDDGVGSYRGCQFVTAVKGDQNGSCESGQFSGGEPIIERFSSHFDWAHEARLDEDTWQVNLDPFTKPVVMAFNANGELVWSTEGRIPPASELMSQIESGTFEGVTAGPDFLLMEPSVGNVGFSKVREQADFTVMFTFGELCSSCQAKLKKWSQPNNLLDYCSNSAGACQLIGVETGEPWNGGWADHHAQVMSTLAEYEVKVPIYLNPVASSEEDPDGLKRLFQGYLSGKMTNWKDEFGGLAYGVLIYSRDGLIVDEFVSNEALENNPVVFDRIKELVEGLRSRGDQ